MDFKKNNEESIVISKEVVAKIATTATLDVEGVAGVVARTQNIRNIIKTQKVSKPVVVDFKDNQYTVEIFIKVNENVKLAEVAKNVQHSVKDSVQSMTGTVVPKVNVHICDVAYSQAQEEESK